MIRNKRAVGPVDRAREREMIAARDPAAACVRPGALHGDRAVRDETEATRVAELARREVARPLRANETAAVDHTLARIATGARAADQHAGLGVAKSCGTNPVTENAPGNRGVGSTVRARIVRRVSFLSIKTHHSTVSTKRNPRVNCVSIWNATARSSTHRRSGREWASDWRRSGSPPWMI